MVDGGVNRATDGIMESNQKACSNPKALATLDGYKRGLVNSLTGNLQRFGLDPITKTEPLQGLIDEMGEHVPAKTNQIAHSGGGDASKPR